MTITLWDGLDDLSLLVGVDFPKADEDALRRSAMAWAGAARQLRELRSDAASSGPGMAEVLGGDAGAAFDQLWRRLCADGGGLGQLADACEHLGKACADVADEVEYAKIEYIGALLVLSAMIAYLLGSAAALGISLAGIPLAIAAAQLTIRTVLVKLVTAVALGAGVCVATDAVAQAVQLLLGHRDDWDWAKTRRAAQDGAVAGAAGAGVLLAAGRVAPALLGRGLGGVAVSGAAGVASVLAVPLAHGELPSGQALALALTSGGAAGLGLTRRGHPDGGDRPLALAQAQRAPLRQMSALVDGSTGPFGGRLGLLDGETTSGPAIGRPLLGDPGYHPAAAGLDGQGTAHTGAAHNGAALNGAAHTGAVHTGAAHDAAAHDGVAHADAATPAALPVWGDDQAVDVIRAHAFRTHAGLGFYAPDDEIRVFAQAVPAADGYVTLDLHGSPQGFHIGEHVVTAEQLARGLREMQAAGLFQLPEKTAIKLLSCDTAVGGDHSPAARLAQALGVEVIAPDRPVWTGLNGDEIVASAVVVDGVWQPKAPPDGSWQVFRPSLTGARPGTPT